MENSKLATVSILIADRHNNSVEVHKILSESGHLVMARLGVNIEPKCIENCYGVISLVAKGSEQEINNLTEKINSIAGIKAVVTFLA